MILESLKSTHPLAFGLLGLAVLAVGEDLHKFPEHGGYLYCIYHCATVIYP